MWFDCASFGRFYLFVKVVIIYIPTICALVYEYLIIQGEEKCSGSRGMGFAIHTECPIHSEQLPSQPLGYDPLFLSIPPLPQKKKKKLKLFI